MKKHIVSGLPEISQLEAELKREKYKKRYRRVALDMAEKVK